MRAHLPIGTMKKTTLVWTFAVCAGALTAQTQEPKKPTPSQEIAKIVAVEEQEGDLAKAEKLYREALAGTALSADAKDLATLRLAELLMRLGRRDDAKAVMAQVGGGKGAVVSLDDVTPKAQDREREATLRAKARELVKEADEKRGDATGAPTLLSGVVGPVAEQLLWIGQPAVPEVIAYLEGLPKANGYHPDLVRGLAAFLWRVGGDQAKAFLQQATENNLRGLIAEGASAATSGEMLTIAESYLRLPDPGLGEGMLDNPRFGKQLSQRFTPDLLVEVMGKGRVQQRVWLLHRCRDGAVAKAPGLFDVVRAAMVSTEPALGTAAQSLLTHERFRNDPDAIEMILDAFDSPLLRDRHLSFPNERVALAAERAKRWQPKLDACIQSAGAWREDSRCRWLSFVTMLVHEHTGTAGLPSILRCLDLGYPCAGLLQGRLTKDNALDVFPRFDRMPKTYRNNFLDEFAAIDLPAELFVDLRTRFDAMVVADPEDRAAIAAMFLGAMVRTGHPDAAALILDDWRHTKDTDQGKDRSSVLAMLELSRRSQDEKVRAAMRTMASAESMFPDTRGLLLLALLSMKDEQALDLTFAYSRYPIRSKHPYGGEDAFEGKPLAWLVQKTPKPPHPYSEAEVLGLLERVGKADAQLLAPHDVSGELVADRMLMELVRCQPMRFPFQSGYVTWTETVMNLVNSRDNKGPLADLVRTALSEPTGSYDLINKAHSETIRAFAEIVKARLQDPEEEMTSLAMERLIRNGVAIDLKELLAHRHPRVRQHAFRELTSSNKTIAIDVVLRLLTDPHPYVREDVCRHTRDRALPEAIPGLLALLRDPDGRVQEVATEALTRIRFVHEQQSHWERITKGLDASPSSAVEKLLLQSKPGAGKEQRLLAITSLGTLGVPEALPFLIDWTKDADAEIQKAAKGAITQIHLQPRK